MKELLKNAISRGQAALSEYDSKRVIATAGVSVSRNGLATGKEEAVRIARELGYPVALKGCGHALTHKTELGIVKLGLGDDGAVASAYDEIVAKGLPMDGVLVDSMLPGDGREFVMGMMRDPQFGPCVMFGLGGIFTEALRDVSFRVAPLTELDAGEMLDEIRANRLLGGFRGSPPVDRTALVRALVGIGRLGLEHPEIAEIDVNPVLVHAGTPVAVDALVVLNAQAR
ncbi:MAG TPA: acetate--CoA ligase family protein [Spirochaetota bacterium]|nr:acetate--CoA ligase family protein [Spirochaetota bacterium]HPI23582.1 acetate--CoA ligase family protein [Spirochaetota bacterium]HPU89748.1 acetate--CoA ligase family protein [Spirochaetota bacterium]